MALKLIPDVVSDQTIRPLRPSDTAQDAAVLMRDHQLSAVVVLDAAGALCGIVTQRDLAYRVVAADRQGSTMTVADVMTVNPATVPPGASPFDALKLMHSLRVRHLPVVQDGRVVGMVSIRDLRTSIGVKGGVGPMGRLGRLLGAVRGPTR